MPKLDQWYLSYGVNNHWREQPNEYTPPELITQHLNGVISEDEHGRFRDGAHVTTSTIVGKKDGKVLTRSGTLYELVSPKPDYEKEFPGAVDRLMDSLPEKAA